MKRFNATVTYSNGTERKFFMNTDNKEDVYDKAYQYTTSEPGAIVVTEVAMNKPVVHYKGKPVFMERVYENAEGKKKLLSIAKLSVVTDHPKLGWCHDVRTSKVMVPMDHEGRFETLNTIYEPVKIN